MRKQFLAFLFLIMFSLSTTGCFLLLAGAAGGAGTAMWFSGKMMQEAKVSRQKAVTASERGLRSLGYPLTQKTIADKVTQIKAEHSDGRTIWVDVHGVQPKLSRIEVRVGVASDKEAARELMNAIDKYL